MTIVIALPGGEEQAAKLAARLGADIVVPEIHRFPDGEICVRIEPARVAGHYAVLCGSLIQPSDKFLLIAFLASTLRDHGARKVGLVAPYLAYMRQDAAFHPGEGITARYFGSGINGQCAYR